MLPVAQAAMSLFGGSLNPVSDPVADPVSSSVAASGSFGGVASAGSNSVSGVSFGQSPISGVASISDVASPAPFADLLVETVGQAQSLDDQAKSAIEGLISGKGVDVHEAMIAAQKAGMGFELVLSLRNKALSAYQQVMGMQF